MTLQFMSSDDVAIVFRKGNDFNIHCWHMSKDEAVNLSRNIDLTKKSGKL